MSRKVHRDNAKTRRDKLRSEETILLTEVAEAGRADDQRAAAAGVVVGNLPGGELEELRRLICARVCGFDIQKQPLEARKRLAYVPDYPFLYDKLTAWEFFRFIGQLFHLEAEHIEKNAQELVARFHLTEFADRSLEGLSHGTRQRVAIVSALLHDPEVFVIDEPMVGLDPQHTRIVKDVLKERSLAGMTVLVSTHQLSIAEEMADRIGIMNGGKLIAVGTRDELRNRTGGSGQLEEIFLSLTAAAK